MTSPEEASGFAVAIQYRYFNLICAAISSANLRNCLKPTPVQQTHPNGGSFPLRPRERSLVVSPALLFERGYCCKGNKSIDYKWDDSITITGSQPSSCASSPASGPPCSPSPSSPPRSPHPSAPTCRSRTRGCSGSWSCGTGRSSGTTPSPPGPG